MMSPDLHLSAPRKLTGFHVLAILLGFFFTVTGVNVVMMYSAITTFGGLDTEDPYRKGLAYNQTLAQDEAQAKLGWQAYVAAAPSRETVVVEMTGADEAAVTGLAIKGTIGRAATNRFDKPLAFHEIAPGRYEAVTGETLDLGAWIAKLSAVKANPEGTNTVFEVKQRLWIAP